MDNYKILKCKILNSNAFIHYESTQRNLQQRLIECQIFNEIITKCKLESK